MARQLYYRDSYGRVHRDQAAERRSGGSTVAGRSRRSTGPGLARGFAPLPAVCARCPGFQHHSLCCYGSLLVTY